MTITVTAPAPGASPINRLGQGLRIVGTISGPTAIDDFLQAELAGAFLPQLAAVGVMFLAGASSFDIWLDGEPPPGLGIPDNALCSLALTARHADGTIFDSVSYPGSYNHDPTSGLGSFILRNVTKYVFRVYT